MFQKIKDVFMNKKENNDNYEIKLDFSNDFIKLLVFKNNERINIFDYRNDIYDFFLQSNIFSISKDKNYIELSYKNIYKIEEEYFNFFGLPQYFNGYIKINNSANFLNKNGVKFEIEIYDNNVEFDRSYFNIVQNRKDGSKQILLKEQYELLENIENYNRGENNKIPSEQYNLLNSIRETAKHTSIILGDTLKQKENIVVIDNIIIDFIENEEGNYNLLPVVKEFSEEENRQLQEEFKKRNFGKDFYTVKINGKKTQVIFNSVLKKDMNAIKRDKPEVTKTEMINGDIQVETSENIDFSKWGERVKGLGFLPYRPSPHANTSDIDWFSKEPPSIFHDEGSIKLTPDKLNYLQEKLASFNEEEEKIILEFETEEGRKFINIGKDNLENEVNKLKNSIIDFKKIKNKNKLQEIMKFMKNSGKEYIEYEGKYIQNENDISIVETYINDIENNQKKKEQERKKVLLIKDNLETNEYMENEKNSERVKIEKVEVPKALKKEFPLYDYQNEGVLKLQSLYKQSKINGILLCDDMGLGKTIQILTFLAWIKENYKLKPALIILPTSLIYNWKEEMEKFFIKDTFSFDIMQGNVDLDEVKLYLNKDIILTSYESLRINHIKTANVKWKIIICDEAQKMKNPKTLLTTAIKSQNVEFKIACSATPIENTIEDLWCLTDFVKPGLLGNLRGFRKKYAKNKNLNNKELEKQNEELKNILQKFYIRRMKDEALKDEKFPKKIIKYQQVKISKKQIEVLNEFSKLRDGGQKVLPLIQGMLMSCSHPRLVGMKEFTLMDSDEEKILEESFKLESIKKILENVKRKEEKVIIFTKYKKMQEILLKIINYWFKFIPKRINGDYNSNSRRDILKEYKEKMGFNILILSPEAAGVGLNIVEANHVIHYTRHWNPAKEEQATDRAYRIGQEKDVFVYYPIVSFEVEDIKETTFNSQDEWIEKQINEDVSDKTPEEKLNKIIMRKKRLLRDFFFTAITDTTIEDQREFISKKGDSEFITITTVDNTMKPLKFETLSTILLEREYNGEGYVTVKSGDAGIDGVITSEKDNILIQCKQFKGRVGNKVIDELKSGKKIYERYLNIKFNKLILITTADNVSNLLNLYEENKIIEIIDRGKLANLLNKHKIKYIDVNLRDSERYSLEKLKEELN